MRTQILWTLLFLSSAAAASPLQVVGRGYQDQDGNEVILRGVNVSGVAKVPPFRSILGPEDFEPLPGWGFNSIRLLFNWEAFQPQRERYDEGYLEYYVDMIRWAAQHNLYVIADIHQDAFSRYTGAGCGDGFPEWTLPPWMPRVTPKNDERCKSWGVTTFLDPNMHLAWHEFYKNTGGVRDQYLTMLRKLARAIAHEPNVVGLDFLNEPWGDEKTQLFPLYQEAALVVREEMPETILFFSGAAKTSTGLIPSELPRIPGRNIVHATHFYDPGLPFGSWNPWTLELTNLSWKKLAEEWDTPVFVGEFGASPTTVGAATYVENLYALLDRELYSGTYWVYTPTWNEKTKDGWNLEDFSINDDRGQLRGVYQPRPWVEKVAGHLLAMNWNKTHSALSLRFEVTSQSAGFDVMVPDGFTWMGLPPGESHMTCESDARRLRCALPQAAPGKIVTRILLFSPSSAPDRS